MDGLFKQEGYDVVGAAMEVYNQMRSGYFEEVYQECLELEFPQRGIPCESQPKLSLFYKEQRNELGIY